VTAMMRSCSQNSFSSVIVVLPLPTRTWRISGDCNRLAMVKVEQNTTCPRDVAYHRMLDRKRGRSAIAPFQGSNNGRYSRRAARRRWKANGLSAIASSERRTD
jgi:hypothetical protein